MYDDYIKFLPSSVRKAQIPLKNRQNIYIETSTKKRYRQERSKWKVRGIQPNSKMTYCYIPIKRGEKVLKIQGEEDMNNENTGTLLAGTKNGVKKKHFKKYFGGFL